MQLSLVEARTVMLAAQNLHRRPEKHATKRDVLQTIRRMSALQIDTISVVARSPYLVLWSRLGDYEPCWLDELLAEGKLFEYWSHEACFLPVEDYALYRHRMIDTGAMGWRYSHKWMRTHGAEVERVLSTIRERGAVRSSDFQRTDGKTGGWWEWKPEKRALEMLYTSGELMIARREKFQRIYDLRERVLPSWSDAQLPPNDETRRALILKSVRALGVTTARWVADYFRMNKKTAETLTVQLGDEGALQKLHVENFNEPFYFHPDNLKFIKATLNNKLRAELTTLLSPFDPIVWDRARARAMFKFDYRLECYTPAPKRRYGYFTLPILHRTAFIGRLDAKAHRRDGHFEIKSIHLEPHIKPTDEMINDLAHAFHECAAWHKTPEVIIRRTTPTSLAVPLRRALKSVKESSSC
ncbi:MAG: winged helix-turn-helix domain-containing protein [Pyrinomonadaceae bacterium]